MITSTINPLDIFPGEIFTKIISYLDQEDQNTCREVCRLFRECVPLAIYERIQKPEITLKNIISYQVISHHVGYPHYLSKLTKLTFNHFNQKLKYQFTKTDEVYTARFDIKNAFLYVEFKDLKHLDMQGNRLKDEDLLIPRNPLKDEKLLPFPKELESLNLSNNQITGSCFSALQDLTQLKELHLDKNLITLSNLALIFHENKFDNLKTLTLDYNNFDEQYTENLITLPDSLETLSLNNTFLTTDALDSFEVPFSLNLKHLFLNYNLMVNQSIHALDPLLPPSLESLSLKGNIIVHSRFLCSYILNNLPNLKKLDLSNNLLDQSEKDWIEEVLGDHIELIL